MKKNIKTKQYFEWFNENWTRAGGLINTSTAAKILGIKMPAITQKWKRDKLRKYIYTEKNGKKDLPLLGLRDVLMLKEWRERGIDLQEIDYEKEDWYQEEEKIKKEIYAEEYDSYKEEPPEDMVFTKEEERIPSGKYRRLKKNNSKRIQEIDSMQKRFRKLHEELQKD